MVKFINRSLIIKLIIICLYIIKVAQNKKVDFTIKKTTVIIGKKHHKSISDPIRNLHPEYSYENRKKFIEKEFNLFKLKENKNIEKVEKQKIIKEKNNDILNENNVESNVNEPKEINTNNLKNNISIEKDKNENKGSNYYIYGGSIVSIALVGVGFFNVYQRNRNSIFNLTKEELESIDKSKKMNSSYTSLSEEERRFLHKINTRKHNNMRRYDELTEDEILEIRKKNGWADSDDGECQLRRRKLDNRLSCNVKINSTNVVAPRRISLNVKLDNDLLSKSICEKSCENNKKLKRNSIMQMNKDKLIKYNSDKTLCNETKKQLSINTKDIGMPLKMICTIIKNYKPLRPDEIELHLGDKVEIVSVYKDGWASGKVINNNDDNHKVGYFPLAHASEPEIFDDKINEFIIPSPLTANSRSVIKSPYYNSSLITSNSSNLNPLQNIHFTNSTTSTTKTAKSKNRHISMVAISSSSSVLTQEPLSINSSNSNSIININNNINIINNNLDENNNIPKNININIKINNNDSQKYINNSISINDENTPVVNTNTVLLTSSNLKRRSTTPSILDSQKITDLLNSILEEENKHNNRNNSHSGIDSLPCHSQEVFDFLRKNVYNSKITMEEREYYKKCLERLRISKIIDMEMNQEKCE